MTRATRPLWPLLMAAAAAALGVTEWWAGRGEPPAPALPPGAPAGGTGGSCPSEHLLDDGVCLPLPAPEAQQPEAPSGLELLPGRPPEHERYLTPIAGRSGVAAKTGLGLFVAAPSGTPVMTLALEAQVGPARRLALAGPTPRLVTVHRVERAGAARSYVLLYAGLEAAPSADALLPVGTPLGRVAAGPPPTGLELTVRQLRRGVDEASLDAATALLESSSSSCDARNVLPLKPAP